MSYNFRILVSNTAGVRFELERTYPSADTIAAARVALSSYADVPSSALPARQSYSDGLAFWEDGDVRWTAVATRVAPTAAEEPIASGTATDRYRVLDRETGEQIGMAVEDEAGIAHRAELNPGHDYVNVRTGRIVDTLTLRPSASLKAASREYAPEPWSPAETTTAEALPPAPSQARPEGAFFTAPNTYGHPVRFWARDAEHAKFVAGRAHLRADAVEPEAPVVAQAARIAELERLEARYAEIEAANRRLNEAIRHLSARVEAASSLADAASAAMLALALARGLAGNDGADRPRDVADELEEALTAYRAAGASPTGRRQTAPPLRS